MDEPLDKGSTVQVTFVLNITNVGPEQMSGAKVSVVATQHGAPAYVEFPGVTLSAGESTVLKGFADFPKAEYQRIVAGLDPHIKVFDTTNAGEQRQRSVEVTKSVKRRGDNN